MAKVPDARLDALAKLFEPPKITYATVEYLDLPAISKESSARSRAIWPACAWWMRWRMCCGCFRDDTVPHEKGSVDPVRDFEDVEMELILSDLVVVEKRLERVDKDRKKIKNPELDHEFELLEQCKAALEANTAAARLELDARRREAHSRISVSVAEADAVRAESGRRRCRAAARGGGGVSQRAAGGTAEYGGHGDLRQDRSGTGGTAARRKQKEYLASYGLKESGLERLIAATYSLLGLMCF